MKSMLIAVALVGAALAGLVLYAQQKDKPKNQLKDAAKDVYRNMNEAFGSVERGY